MKHLSRGIPAELKASPQWLGFKSTKAPRVAFGTYHLASSSDPQTHADYETALAAVANGHLDGIGLAVTEFDPFVVVDLDGCRDPATGALTEFASDVVDTLGTYTEISNSGKGLHLVCRSYVDGNYKANEDERAAGRAIEFFATAGFVILTGHTLPGRNRVANVPRARLRALVDELRMSRKARRTYEQTPPPAYEDPPGDAFATLGALGPFARLVISGEYEEALADRFPRDRDGDLDRSKVLFLAAVNLREAGLSAAQAYTVLDQSDWVAGFMAEKSDGWLWRYVVEPAFKSLDGEEPADAVPEGRDAGFIVQADLVASLRPVDWLIDGVLEARAVGVLAGPHSAYKSTVAIDWVHSVASGRPWLGRPVRRGAAVVIAGEGVRGLARRAHAWGVEHGLDEDTLAGLPILWSKAAVQIMDPERMGRAVQTVHETLAERFGVKQPDLVIVDTLNRNFAGGDENSASDIAVFFDRLSRAFPRSCVVVVHHFGKDKNRGTRGSSAIDAALDFLYHAETNAGEVVLRAQKMKDADKPATMYLRPEVVPLKVGDEETTGVTIGTGFRATRVADALGRMKPELQVAATAALAVLGDLGPATRKEWVGRMLKDEIAAETWNKDDRNGWRTQLNKLVGAMLEAGLVEAATVDEDEQPATFKAVTD